MSERKLVAARPWDDQDARRGLIDRAVETEGAIGAVRLSVIVEPLIRTVDGVRTQSVRLMAQGGRLHADGLRPSVTTSTGTELAVLTEAGPYGSVRVLVRAVDAPAAVELRIPSLGDEAVGFTLVPQRQWTVHVVHHSHFDFGYTDRQTEVFASQRSYLDSALDLIEETAEWPEEARFRWNSEALWAITDWESHRPAAQVERLFGHVRGGSIGLSAMPYNLHTDVCSTDELHELLRDARRIRDRHGVEFVSAMQTDVPGQVAGLPDALQSLGVRYLSVAHNWAGRSQPHTSGGLNLPRLFRWRSLAGKEVLVWMTDSPHGLAYMEGPMTGFTEGLESVEHHFPAYLTAMATKGYPFPPGIFGAHGESLDGRDPYPWDVVHLRTQGFMGDNGPARLMLSAIVRDWNAKWEWPRLRVSRNEDFFADAEQRLGDELVTVEGDWGDWWVEGVGSAAVPIAFMRKAQAEVVDARTISQLGKRHGGSAVRDERGEATSAYDAISMFNEHTWGAGDSWSHGDEGFSSGQLQWQWKVAQSLVAQQRSSELLETALSYLGQTLPTPTGAAAAFAAVNPTAIPRSGVTRFLLPESAVPFDVSFEIRDARSGTAVPVAVEPQRNAAHREAGRWVLARVEDVPPMGHVVLEVHPEAAGEPDEPPTGDGVDDGDAEAPGAASDLLSLADEGRDIAPGLGAMPRAQLLTLENEFLRVVVDEDRSAIGSIVERRTGRELVDLEAIVGFNAYVYDRYASSGAGFNHLANKLATSERLEMLASRSVGRPARIVERVDDAIEQRLVYEFPAEGAEWVRVTLRLRHGDPRLLIENRIAKPTSLVKESAYFGFPFAGADPRMRFEVSGGVTGDGLPHIPGAPQHMRAVRDWVLIESEDDAVVWVTKDAPLVEPHAIALPYAPFPASTSPSEPGTLYSWVHNNVWDTNFPIEQGFEAEFVYAIGVRERADEDPVALALRTAAEVVHPLRAARLRGRSDGAATASTGLTLSDPRVQLVGAVEGDDGETILRLQSFAGEAIRLTVDVGLPISRAARTTFLGDEIAPLDARSGLTLDLAPYDVTAVKIEYGA